MVVVSFVILGVNDSDMFMLLVLILLIYFIILGLILMILSFCGCVWGVSATIWTLMVVSRAILDGFGGSLGPLFEALGSLGESLGMLLGVMMQRCSLYSVLEVILRGF